MTCTTHKFSTNNLVINCPLLLIFLMYRYARSFQVTKSINIFSFIGSDIIFVISNPDWQVDRISTNQKTCLWAGYRDFYEGIPPPDQAHLLACDQYTKESEETATFLTCLHSLLTDVYVLPIPAAVNNLQWILFQFLWPSKVN